jgi:phage terminase small subunit
MRSRTLDYSHPTPLRDKQKRFVEEYLVDLNATQAAVRAGYSPSSAHVTASRLLSKADVRHAIEATLSERFSVTKLTIIEELAAIAFHDIADYMTWTESAVHVTPSHRLTDWQRKAIVSVREVGKGSGCLELALSDKLRALELLARVLGLFDRSHGDGHRGTVNFVIETPG